MPTFDTPTPITVAIRLASGHVRVQATKREDTVVEVRPTDETKEADGEAAAATTVAHEGDRLAVRGPKPGLRQRFGRGGSVDVDVSLPEGSHLDVTTSSADIDCAGALHTVRATSASGEIRTERASTVRASTASGGITIGRVDGDVFVESASGEVQVGDVAGNAVARTASGPVRLGSVTGDLRASAASGDVSIGRTRAAVGVKVASGNVRIAHAGCGLVRVDAGSGGLDVGVPEGTAAWLDLRSGSGQVRSSLNGTDGPAQADEKLKIRARTGSGDILIHRA